MVAAPAAVLAGLALALAGCGGSGGGSTHGSTGAPHTTAPTTASTATTTSPSAPGGPNVVSASRGGVTATMHPHGHHPVVGRPWPISFTVTRAGRPARASVSYEYLFGGQVVARRSHYAFRGRFSDVFHWPATAVGYRLTFRAVITAGSVRIDLDYPVQVVR